MDQLIIYPVLTQRLGGAVMVRLGKRSAWVTMGPRVTGMPAVVRMPASALKFLLDDGLAVQGAAENYWYRHQ